MNSKYVFTAIAIVVVAIIAIVALTQNKDGNEVASQTNTSNNSNAVNDQQNANTPPLNANANNVNTNQPAPVPGEPTIPDGNDVAVFEITYDGKAYSPSQLTIKNGDVVIFKNASTGSFWPASAPHPQHTNYPEFDPKKSVGAGQSWQFKFAKTGAWAFHDHLNPTVFGKITVQ
jgi:plastocyanin